jgi:regulator of protease activity HflC (stomatin/prohibitin superfamily)
MAKNYSGFSEFENKNLFSGGKLKRLGLLGLLFLGLLVLLATFKTVPAGHRAVVFNNITGGVGARGEGLTILMPFTQTATLYDVRTQNYTMSRIHNEGAQRGDDAVPALTSDGQEVAVDVSILFHPDPNRIAELHRNIGIDYVRKIIRPAGRSVTRSAVTKYPVIDLYGPKRSVMQDEVAAELKAIYEKSYIILDSVLIRNVDFSAEFKNAIEQKQVAQQAAERKKYELETEKIEKERKIVAAEGDAEAIRLRGEALSRNPGLIQYEYVQKITPGIQTVITDGKSILSLGDVVNRGKSQ